MKTYRLRPHTPKNGQAAAFRIGRHRKYMITGNYNSLKLNGKWLDIMHKKSLMLFV